MNGLVYIARYGHLHSYLGGKADMMRVQENLPTPLASSFDIAATTVAGRAPLVPLRPGTQTRVC